MAKQKGQQSSSLGFTMYWVYMLILVLTSFGVYYQTLSYKYTELDDSIFISENEGYNRAPGSFMKSFRRGVFSDSTDTYYRPLLLNSFVVDRKLEGKLTATLHANKDRSDISRYHLTNILLHMIAVALLFVLLRRLLGNDTTAFVLSLLFAVHPALVQAVAWVPGRNDPLLAVFALGFLISVIEYVQKGSIVFLLLQPVLLLCALLSKETGIIVAPVALVVLLVMQGVDWKNKRVWWLCASWAVMVAVWLFAFRSQATVKNQDLTIGVLASSFIERLPLIIQYVGKIILPFNLTVFPQQQDTTLLYGIASLLIIGGIITLSVQKNWRMVITGIVWFLAFVFPVLIVPKSLNQETFEHRLYLPIIGVLLLLAQVLSIKGINERLFRIVGISLCVVFAVTTVVRSNVFRDKWKFWECAVADSPSSAYAKMMLGMRYFNDADHPEKKENGENLLFEAYKINPDEKYLNFYIGNIYLTKGQPDSALAHYTIELPKNPQWAELVANIARVNIERKDFNEGEKYLLRWLELEPASAMANSNLLILYVNDLKKPEKAREQASKMKQMGLDVPDDIARPLGLIPTPAPAVLPSGGTVNTAPSAPVLVPNTTKP